MEDSDAIFVIGVMDYFWFRKIVLFSRPNSVLVPNTLVTRTSLQEVPISQSSLASIPKEEILMLTSSTSFAHLLEDYTSGNDDESEKDNEEFKERPTRLSIITSRARFPSSSSSTQEGSRSLIYSSPVTRLQKTMSCKTLWELQEEEVKGFIDLGLRFDKENVCPRMTSVLPGLQRLGRSNQDEEEDEGRGIVLRPSLSEALLVKRLDPSLMSLGMSKMSIMDDMKKHLKF